MNKNMKNVDSPRVAKLKLYKAQAAGRSRSLGGAEGSLLVPQADARRGSLPLEPPKPPTLLEKAEQLRRSNGGRWEEMRREREKREEERRGRGELHPFVRQHNDDIIRRRAEKQAAAIKHKAQPRQIVLRLEYRKDAKQKRRISERRISTDIDVTETFLDLESQDKSPSCETTCDFVLTASTGKFLRNGIEDGIEDGIDDLQQTCVKVFVFPDHERRQTKMKSSLRYITAQGTTKWDHRFVFHGSPQFKQQYLVVVVSGQTANGKISLGQAILAGDGALIKERSFSRAPREEERKPLQDALKSRDTCITTTMTLNEEDFQEVTITDRLKQQVGDNKITSMGRRMSATTQRLGRRFSEAPAALPAIKQVS